MSLQTKKVTELESLEKLTDETNLVVEDGGKTKRFPAKDVGKVKRVNGVEPDEDGNVPIELPEGYPYKETKTVSEPFSFTWDGNADGLLRVESEDGWGMYCVVPDVALTHEQIKTIALQPVKELDNYEYSFAENWDYLVQYNYVSDSIVYCDEIPFVFCLKDNQYFDGVLLPKSGIYTLDSDIPAVLTFKGDFTLERTVTEYHPLDHRFLPEGVPYKVVTGEVPEEKEVKVYTGYVDADNHSTCVHYDPPTDLVFNGFVLGDRYRVEVTNMWQKDDMSFDCEVVEVGSKSEIIKDGALGLHLITEDGIEYGVIYQGEDGPCDGCLGIRATDSSTHKFGSCSISIYQLVTVYNKEYAVNKIGMECLPDDIPHIESKKVYEERTGSYTSQDGWALYDLEFAKLLSGNPEYAKFYCPADTLLTVSEVTTNGMHTNFTFEEGGYCTVYLEYEQVYFNHKDTGSMKMVFDGVADMLYPLDARLLPKDGLVGVKLENNGEIFNNYNSNTAGEYAHAEGDDTSAYGICSHAEGFGTAASADYSHAEGYRSVASGNCAHVEGQHNTASGFHSHAEGQDNVASGQYAHVEGLHNLASSAYQHVHGLWNIEDKNGTYLTIVGNGRYNKRSNAYTLSENGDGWFAGTVEGTGVIVKSSTSGSNKRFKITVDDSGAITAVEV